MSRAQTKYARQPAELYQTPSWVLDALVEHLPIAFKSIWEPACGEGKMVRAMERHLASVHATDLHDHGFDRAYSTKMDFLKVPGELTHHDGIISNPPFGPRGELAIAFIRHGLKMIARRGFMAMLLPVDFDSASTRADVFELSPQHIAKVTLRKRIVWFDKAPEPGKKKVSPQQNHAWHIWGCVPAIPSGPAKLLYGPKIKESKCPTN